MATDSAIVEGAQPATGARKRVALRWGLWGALSVPPTVLLHELGHFSVFRALGLPGAALHYGSAGFSRSGDFFRAVLEGDFGGAAEIAPVWGVATALGMGLVATYLVVFACCYLSAKWKPHPLLVAVGYLSNVRIGAALPSVVLPLLGVANQGRCDECWLSALTGIPVAVWAFPGLVSLVGAGIWLWRYFPRDKRWLAVGSMCLGMAMGLAVYAGFVGPLLLP